MQQLLGIGVLAMILADAIVGVRLLLLAHRTRQLPELYFGLSFVSLGVIGYPLSIVARKAAMAGAPVPGLLPAALIFQDIAAITMFLATWQTFRPRARWPLAVTGLGVLGFAGSLLGDSIASGSWLLRDGGFWYEVGFWTRAGAYVWAAIESGRYAANMRLRLQLELADPVIVDRFDLWTISTTAISFAFAFFYMGRLWADNVATSVPVLAATSICGLVAGMTVWLAFLPPEWYVARVRRRARFT